MTHALLLFFSVLLYLDNDGDDTGEFDKKSDRTHKVAEKLEEMVWFALRQLVVSVDCSTPVYLCR